MITDSEWKALVGCGVDLGNANYTFGEILGRGDASTVYITESNGTGRVLKMAYTGADRVDDALYRLGHFAKYAGPGVVNPCAWSRLTYLDRTFVGAVMDMAEGSLEGLLANSSPTQPERLEILIQVGRILQRLHQDNYQHLNIKPSNVLCFGETWKLADAAFHHDSSETKAIESSDTLQFAPPESAFGVEESAWDVWSFGVLACLVLFNRLPFPGEDSDQVRWAMMTGTPSIPSDAPANFAELLTGCLQHDRDDRWDMDRVLANLDASGTPLRTRFYGVIATPNLVDLSQPTLDVSPRGQYHSITEAIQAASPGQTIRIFPGLYQESIVLGKDVSLTGVGSRDSIIIESTDKTCMTIAIEKAVVRGLTLRVNTNGSGTWTGLYIQQGQPLIEDCDISSDCYSCVIVDGKLSSPTILKCHIFKGEQAGVLFVNGAKGLLDECEIHNNEKDGILILNGGNPTVRNCELHDNGEDGIHVAMNGCGIIDECDIHDNEIDGISIMSGGNPTVRNCDIHDNVEDGIYVSESGIGRIDACDLHDNAMANVMIRTSGNPTITNCEIHAGTKEGVYVYDAGVGTIEGCNIHDNETDGISIQTGGNPVVRNCELYDNGEDGLCISENGIGQIDVCDIHANTLEGVEISTGGNPAITNCEIHNGKQSGVLVRDNGIGTIQECNIHNNRIDGISIESGGSPVIHDCDIHNNDDDGVYLSDTVSVTIEECDIYDNGSHGIAMDPGTRAVVRKCDVHDNGEDGSNPRATDPARPVEQGQEVTGQTHQSLLSIHGPKPSDIPADVYKTMLNHAASEWPTDFSVQASVMKWQIEGYREIHGSKPSDIPADVYKTMLNHAASEWPTDFSVQASVLKWQIEGYREIHGPKPSDIPADVYKIMLNHAASEWPTDFSMQASVLTWQIEAFRERYSS